MPYYRYAGIGSREIPEHIGYKMQHLAMILARSQFMLVTGGALGADEAFAQGTSYTQRYTMLPWDGYNGKSVDYENVFIGANPNTIALASSYHPNWAACSQGIRKLHGRNMAILFGLNLNEPVDFVLCWTKDGKASGGTGQAIRAAACHNIPILNLWHEDAEDKLNLFLTNLENTDEDHSHPAR